MTNLVSSQFSRYVTDVYELQEKFQGIASTKDLPILQKMQKLAAKLQEIGGLFAKSRDLDEYEQELTLDTLGIVMSIEGELTCRIQVLLKAAPPPLSTSLEILAAIVSALSNKRDASEIKALFDQLPPKTQEKICENLWRVVRCLAPKIKGSPQDFGRESLFGTKPQYVLSPLQKRLAVELCMTPSLIIEKGIHLIYSGEESKLLDLFNLIPKKIQERVFGKLWESMGKTTPYPGYIGSDDFSAIIKDQELRIDIKIGILLELNEATGQSEHDVNALVERAQNEFLAIDDLYPDNFSHDISMTTMIKKLMVHDIARDLLGILDSEAFVESTKDSIQEIIADYHARYPSLLHARVLFLFELTAFTAIAAPLVDNKLFMERAPSVVATATASAADKVFGGSITVRGGGGSITVRGGGGTFRDVVIDGTFMMMPPPPAIKQDPVTPGAAGTGECPDSKKIIDASLDSSWVVVGPAPHPAGQEKPGSADASSAFWPMTEAHDIAPSIDETLRMLKISPRDSMIAINPKILRSCPEELRQLVAQAVMMDWKATSYITSETLFSADVPMHHVNRVLWGLETQVKELQKFISTLEGNSKARDIRDVLEILKVKEKNLSETYRNLLNYALARTLHTDDEVFGRLPHRLYERALVLSRLNLHVENVNYLRSKNPTSGMILKLQDKIRELEKWLAELPPCTSQIELLQEDSFVEVYLSNLLLSNFWLQPSTIDRLMGISGAYERNALSMQLNKDISKIRSVIKGAKSYLSPMPQGEKKEAFNREIQALEEQLNQAKNIFDQIIRISILGIRDSNRNLFKTISSPSIDRNLVEAIKHQRLEFAQKSEQNYLENVSVFPASYDAAKVCLYEVLESMRTA